MLGLFAQVFLDVLHVREPGLCSADASENTKLEATLQILPLVGATSISRVVKLAPIKACRTNLHHNAEEVYSNNGLHIITQGLT